MKDKMKVSLIVAVSKNNAIGKDNDLLWHLPNDMRYFKQNTLGHHIITGRKNYISIPPKYRPLVERTNIVLTRNTEFTEPDCIVEHSLESALKVAEDNNESEVFIIGGGQIYKEALEKDVVDALYVTHVEAELDADTFFPAIDGSKWKAISTTNHCKDDKHAYDYSFVVYEKMN